MMKFMQEGDKMHWRYFAFGGLCLACILAGLIIFHRTHLSGEVMIDPQVLYRVTHVVDGDTFKAMIGRREITLRLLGINTPETVDPRKQPECYGQEASTETKSLLRGHLVRLELNPNREVRDKYGRYLVYAYRDDGPFLNEELLREGFAREYTFGSIYSFQREFRKIQKEAHELKKGLWGKCPESSKKFFTSPSTVDKYLPRP